MKTSSSQHVRSYRHSRTCDFTAQVSVLVGPDEQLFLIHEDLICAKSNFFAAACSDSKRWVEGKEKQVRLPEVNPSVFQSYLSWVYSTSLNITELTTDQIDQDQLPDTRNRNVAKHLELYFLGDVLDDVRLRNKVMQILVLDTDNAPCLQTIARVWEKTPEDSPVRRMIVDRAVLRTKRENLIANMTRYPANFVQHVAVKLLQEVSTKEKEVFQAKLPSYLVPVEKVD